MYTHVGSWNENRKRCYNAEMRAAGELRITTLGEMKMRLGMVRKMLVHMYVFFKGNNNYIILEFTALLYTLSCEKIISCRLIDDVSRM